IAADRVQIHDDQIAAFCAARDRREDLSASARRKQERARIPWVKIVRRRRELGARRARPNRVMRGDAEWGIDDGCIRATESARTYPTGSETQARPALLDQADDVRADLDRDGGREIGRASCRERE